MEADDLWREAYEGEVLGEALFSALADGEADPGRRDQLRALTVLERSTRELAEPVVAKRGITADVDAVRAGAVDMAGVVAGLAWDDFLGSFEPVISQYLAKYRRLVTLAEGDDERAVAEAYVAHELALESFLHRARGEQEGDPVQPILDLPHVRASGHIPGGGVKS